MGKQTKILRKIINAYQQIDLNPIINKTIEKNNSIFIREMFKRSLNKNEIIRRILNQVVLSNDEIVSLLRIIYKKKESKK